MKTSTKRIVAIIMIVILIVGGCWLWFGAAGEKTDIVINPSYTITIGDNYEKRPI